LAGVGHLLEALKAGNDIRADKVAQIKAQIEGGTYEDFQKLAIAVDRLLDEVLGDPRMPPLVRDAVVEGVTQGLAAEPQPPPVTETVLHRLTGRVNAVDGETAHISLVDEQGREAFASCAATELASYGIGPASAFQCTFTRLGNATTVRLEPVSKRKLTSDEARRAFQKTEQVLGGYDPATDR